MEHLESLNRYFRYWSNKLSDSFIDVISCIPQTTLLDKNKNKLIYRKDNSNEQNIEIYD